MTKTGTLGVFLLIDALGWKILEQRSMLERWLPYRRRLRTVLGFSSGAIPTILTGRPPQVTGRWNLCYYDPVASPFRWFAPFTRLPAPLIENRAVRKALTEAGRRLLGCGPLFECCVSPRILPYFNWAEKRNLYAHGALDGVPTIFDQLSDAGIPHHVLSYHQGDDASLLRMTQQQIEGGEPGFHFTYLCELDAFLHKHIDDDRLVTQRLQWYAERCEGLFQSAIERDPSTTLAVFSDHGMTPVRRHFDIAAAISECGFRSPRDYLAVLDSTMVRMWFFSDRARGTISERLEILDCGRLLSRTELQSLGVWFSDRRYGEAIFLLHPGCLVSAGSAGHRGWRPVGMHGYHPDDPDSDAAFLSNRPVPFPMESIADTYRFMRDYVNRECLCEA